MLHTLGVDVSTTDAKRLIRRLKRLVCVRDAWIHGVYHQDVSICQVHVEVEGRDGEWLDSWLWRVNHGCDYYGVFTVKEV